MTMRPTDPSRTPRGRLLAALAAALAGVLLLGGCASLPESSQPQALGTINREPTSAARPRHWRAATRACCCWISCKPAPIRPTGIWPPGST